MALEPGIFDISVSNMGQVISVGRTFGSSEAPTGDHVEALPEALDAKLTQNALPESEQAWTATAWGISVMLTYTREQVDVFTDQIPKMIIAACQSVIDECLGVDPTHDKAIE